MVKCWPCKRHFPTSVAAASLCLCSGCSSFQLRPFTQKKLSRLWNLSSMLHVGRIKIRSIYAQWLGQLAKSRRQQLRWLFGCAPLQWLHHLKAHWSFLPFPSMYSANPRLLVVLIVSLTWEMFFCMKFGRNITLPADHITTSLLGSFSHKWGKRLSIKCGHNLSASIANAVWAALQGRKGQSHSLFFDFFSHNAVVDRWILN